tara:strand:+ start:1798 stop:2061 length:264 start_codon:yes stop_codon:yes gene_type:complete
MIKELLKPIILGIFIIIGVYIHTEQTKYEITTIPFDKGVGYHILNKKNGEVKSRVVSNGKQQILIIKWDDYGYFLEGDVEKLETLEK